jgi:signal transduction histidine kinase
VIPHRGCAVGNGIDGPAGYRVAALQVTARSGPVTVCVGSPTAPLSSTDTELGTTLVVGVPAMILLLTLIGWWLLGKALRPVDAIGRQAAAIPGTDRQHRFVADAAHELRTPLARLRARMEIDLRHPGPGSTDAAAMRDRPRKPFGMMDCYGLDVAVGAGCGGLRLGC